MKIRTRLILILISIIAFSISCGVVFIWNTQQLAAKIDRMRTDNAMISNIFMLRVVAEEYSDYGESRPLLNWNILYKNLGPLLAKTHPPEQFTTYREELLILYKDIDPLFQQIVQQRKENDRSDSILFIKKVLSNDLERMVEISTQFHARASEDVLKTQNKTISITLILILLMGIVILFNLFHINFSILNPLNELIMHTREISEGNYSQRMQIRGKDEFARLGIAFNEMSMKLEATNQALEQELEEKKKRERALIRSNRDLEHFAYIASHDLQEPLRSVSGAMQLLKKNYGDNLDSGAQRLVDYGVYYSQKMRNLVEDLLTYSRVSTKGREPQLINSALIVADAINHLKALTSEHGAKIRCDSLPVVYADETQLLEVFQNLITNAIKFNNGSTPEIAISAQETHDEWIFAVQDNGIGIDAQFHDRIFTIFQQLDRKASAGSGMGLSIAKKIIERHEGKIWVSSQIGQGSTFFFSLPKKPGAITHG